MKIIKKWTAPPKNDARVLGMPNIPSMLQGSGCQPRTIVGKANWDKMRKRCYYKANYKCEACGKDLEKGNQHAHELFTIDYTKGTSTFERLVCLCPQCVDEDTEVLTKDGWKKIPQITTNDLVACWDKTGEITFEHPTDTIESFHENAIEVKGHGSTLYFSDKHRLPLRVANKQSSTYGQVVDVLAGKYSASHYYNWLIGGENRKDEHLTPEERVYIAIEADGHIAYDKENPRHKKRQRAYSDRYDSKNYRYTYAVSLLKARKIERLKWLLEESGMKYKIVKETSANYCEFVIWSNKELKHFDNCFDVDMGSEKALEFIEELIFWDGTYAQGVTTWFTNKPEEIDFVQAIAAQCNIRTTVTVVNRIGNLRKGQWKTPYERLSYSVNFRSVSPELSGRVMRPKTIKWGKNMYCLSVPTTYFIARRDNLVFVTGNCHVYGVHSGRALTFYKHGDPLYSAERLLDGAENLFKTVYEWNKVHKKKIEVFCTIADYLKQDELREPMQKLIDKYEIEFYKPVAGKKQAPWDAWEMIYNGKRYHTPYKDHKDYEQKMAELNKSQQRHEMTDRLHGGVFDEIDKIIQGEENERRVF